MYGTPVENKDTVAPSRSSRQALSCPDMHTQAGSTLLGDHGQLCHAFWHVPTTPEAGFQSPVCLRVACEGNECVGKGTVLVARLQVRFAITPGSPTGCSL